MNERIQAIADAIPADVGRFGINLLSDFRAEAGPQLAEHLATTPPEERTWADGLMVALVCLTDMADGKGADLFGPTEDGSRRDKRADRKFVMPEQKVLRDNGEIPDSHFALKRLREGSMWVLRQYAAARGETIPARQENRQKTFFEMAELSAAHSPLATYEDLLRWGASAGTALSLASFGGTLYAYIADRRNGKEHTTDTPRNSPVRKLVAGHIERAAELAERIAPDDMSASDITKASKRMVEASAALALARPDKPFLPTTGYIVGSLGDALDGAWARRKGETCLDGMIEDVKADLEQQIVVFAALGLIAQRRGNRVAATNYALAAMTTPLVAWTRADAEAQGLIVAEGGLGTSLGRRIMAGVGMGLNKHRDTSDIVSAMIVASNANTIRERRHVVKHGSASPYCKGTNTDPRLMNEGEARRDAITPFVELGLFVGAALLADSGMQLFARAEA